MLTKGTIINNQYRLVEELGTGLSATVWRAETLSQPAFYVLKIFNLSMPKRKQDFYNECEVMKQFNLPEDSFVHFGIHSFTTESNNLGIIVSQWAEYGTLANLIEKLRLGQENLSSDELQILIFRIISGLSSIHSKKNLAGQYLVHRDLKPANILLSEKTKPFIADFAISSWVDNERITENPIGAIEYMSPEALEGHISQSIDIWAVGAICYELLTKKPLYSRTVWTSPTALMREICAMEKEVPYNFPDDLQPKIKEIICKALQKNPLLRYSSVLEMKHDLESSLQFSNTQPQLINVTSSLSFQNQPTISNNFLNTNSSNNNPLTTKIDLSDTPNNSTNLRASNNLIDSSNSRNILSDKHQKIFWSQAKIGGIVFLATVLLLRLSYIYINAYDELNYPPPNLLPQSPPKALLANFSPPGMVLIPAGTFLMGLPNTIEKEFKVEVKAFYLDMTEVTNEEFSAFLKANADNNLLKRWKNWTFKETERYYPVTNVIPSEAEAYAQWLGKRLPTEIEWEYAARGNNLGEKKYLYPWGDSKKEIYHFANSKEDNKNKPVAVGSYPEGKSPFGVLDLAGNVAEWTASCHQSNLSNQQNPGTCSDEERIFRGGSYHDDAENIRTTSRFWLGQLENPKRRQEILLSIGFRCAQDLSPK